MQPSIWPLRSPPRTRRRRAVWRPSACALVAASFLFPVAACAQSRDSEAGRRLELERRVAEIKAEHPDVATITAAALKEALPAGNFVLVEVRTEKERAVSHPARRDQREGLRGAAGGADFGGTYRGGLLHHRRPQLGLGAQDGEAGGGGAEIWRAASWPGPTQGRIHERLRAHETAARLRPALEPRRGRVHGDLVDHYRLSQSPFPCCIR